MSLYILGGTCVTKVVTVWYKNASLSKSIKIILVQSALWKKGTKMESLVIVY